VALALVVGLAPGAGAAVLLGGAGRARPAQRSTSGATPAGGRPDVRLEAPSPPHELASPKGQPVLGYAIVPRASTLGRHGEELRAQFQAITAGCQRRGLVLVDVVREREPDHGKALQRPGLGYALRRIEQGEATGLVVADVSRISRSVTDLGEVLKWFSHTGARLVVVSPGLDTGEQEGRLAASALIDVSRWERDRLSDRTRKGLEAALREGRRRGRSGVADNPELRERIAGMRAEGMTLQAIADRLNQEGVPTVRGGVLWRPSSVQAAVGYRRPERGGRAGAVPDTEGAGTGDGGLPI
jgi:DNA invertase Pin-like site-specific DNA recombinase